MSSGILQVGQLVSSKAGRDKDKYFLVLDILNESFVRVVDGEKRKLESPKRKNIKHLKVHPVVAASLAEKFKAGERVTDGEVCQAINGLVGASD